MCRTRTRGLMGVGPSPPMLTPPSRWLPDIEGPLHANKTVFGAATLSEAWTALHHAMRTSTDRDALRVLQDRDLVALAAASAAAEYAAALDVVPPQVRLALTATTIDLTAITELYIHMGQEAVVYTRVGAQTRLPYVPTAVDIRNMFKRLSSFGVDRRACIPGTLHRVGVFVGRSNNPVGCTVRIGKFLPGVGRAVVDLVGLGSVLIVSPPGHGKTTLLRDMLATLSRRRDPPRVVVIDTSNEITGDGDSVTPYYGSTRRLQVPNREAQLSVMLQGVQNHTPEILVVDEIATREEAEAVCSVCQRGVKVVCTVHGAALATLVRNPMLNSLVGGSTSVILSYEEKRAKGKTRKTVLERCNPCAFTSVVELTGINKGMVYHDLDRVVDSIFESENWERGGQDMARAIDMREEYTMPCDAEKVKLLLLVSPEELTSMVPPPKRRQHRRIDYRKCSQWDSVWSLWNEGNLVSLGLDDLVSFLTAQNVAVNAQETKTALVGKVEKLMSMQQSSFVNAVAMVDVSKNLTTKYGGHTQSKDKDAGPHSESPLLTGTSQPITFPISLKSTPSTQPAAGVFCEQWLEDPRRAGKAWAPLCGTEVLRT